MTTTARCPRCGADRPTAAAFCSKCGARMTPPSAQAGEAFSASGQSAAPPPSGATSPASHAPNPPSSWTKIGTWTGAAAVLLIGGGLRQIGLAVAHNPRQATSLFHNPFDPRPLATSLRSFERGDSWDYHISGTVTLADGRSVAVQDGSLHSEITNSDAGGDFKKLTEEDTVNMTASADGRTLPFSHTARQTLSQDWLKATTFLMSDNGGPQDSIRHVRQPQVDTPGSWAVGTTQSVHLDFDDGESKDETTTVQGSEVADTVLGKFSVWRCTQEEADSDGTRSTTTLWFAPQVGMPVRASGTTTLPSGMVMTLNTDLVKTTVPL